MDEKGLGQRLQDARKAAGLTQQDLCHKADLSYSTLAKIERGAIKSPSIFTIQSIATALGIGLDALLGTVSTGSIVAEKQKHVARNGVRFIYFDVNGCLVRFFHGAFAQLAKDTGARADEVEALFWHYNDAVCRGDMSIEDFNKELARQLGVKQVDWATYYLQAVQPIADMQELVGWVAEHYQVGLLTNIMPGFVTAMQQRHILPDVAFDTIVDSSEVGAIKPERTIFEVATKRAEVKPEEILLVDDDRANLMAADRSGWHALWFDVFHAEDSVKRIRALLELTD